MGQPAMNEKEIIERKALLHDQAASLLREEAEGHEKEAEKLREEARKLRESKQ